MPDHPTPSIKDLRPGDHTCFVYETEAEHRAVLTEFIRDGLKRGEKVFYVAEAHTPALLIDYLWTDPGLGHYLKTGQLQTLPADRVYLSSGAFDTDRMIQFLTIEVKRTLEEGYTALRGTGEMSWALKGALGSEQLAAYESRINGLFPGRQLVALCQYDRRVFPPALLLDALLAHPFVAAGPSVARNRYHVPDSDFLLPAGKKAARERMSRDLGSSDVDSLLKALGLPARPSC